MTEQTTTESAAVELTSGHSYTEAPASFTVKAISPQGFDCMLTIRDSNTASLIPRVSAALDWLQAHGFTPPYFPKGKGGNANGNGGGDAPMCPTHNRPMKPSKQKSGGWYCTEKIADDDGTGKPVYCKQTVK